MDTRFFSPPDRPRMVSSPILVFRRWIRPRTVIRVFVMWSMWPSLVIPARA